LERERAAVDAARKQLEEARLAAAAATAANEAQAKSRHEIEQQAQLADARRERERLQTETAQHIPALLPDVASDCNAGSSPTLKENFFPVQVSLDIRCSNFAAHDMMSISRGFFNVTVKVLP
jgi:hypothetical protein